MGAMRPHDDVSKCFINIPLGCPFPHGPTERASAVGRPPSPFLSCGLTTGTSRRDGCQSLCSSEAKPKLCMRHTHLETRRTPVVAPVFGCPVCLGRSLFIPPPHCHLHSRHHQALWPCTTRVVSVLSPTPVALHNVRGGCR